MSLVSKPAPAKNPRRLGALVAYTTLACSLVSIGVYVYRKKKSAANGRPSSPDQSGSARPRRADGVEDGPPESASSLSKLGSRIARTVKRNRKVLTISIKNTVVWNPSPDPTTPNYGFVEGVVPLLFHLAENYQLHLILLCPSSSSSSTPSHANNHDHHAATNGKARTLTIQEEDTLKANQQLGREREKLQILTMLANVGLVSPSCLPTGSTNPDANNGGNKDDDHILGNKNSSSSSSNSNGDKSKRRLSLYSRGGDAATSLIDPRRFLICETEEGISHVVRHLESQVHIDASQEVVELVQGVVPRVVYVDRRPLATPVTATAQDQQQRTNGQRMSSSSSSSLAASSSSSSSSSSKDGDQDWMTRSNMEGSFVEIQHGSTRSPAKEPLVSGYVTQAGKRGYVEVVDSLLKSTLHPETLARR